MVDNGAIVSAVTLDPQSLNEQAYSAIFKAPQRYTRRTPRIDYQLNETNTLSLRYGVIRRLRTSDKVVAIVERKAKVAV